MEEINQIKYKGALIAEIKSCSSSHPAPSSILTHIKNFPNKQEKIKLKCVMKNTDIVEKKSPKNKQKTFLNQTQQVNFDYFLFIYLDKNDHPEFKQYIKEVKDSQNVYKFNMIIVNSIEEFKTKFNQTKNQLCHKRYSLIASQYGILNCRQYFKDIHEIHIFVDNHEKYSNLSYLMKDSNVKSILYDLHKLDQLLQDFHVLKKDVTQKQLPSAILVQKLRKTETAKRRNKLGSTGSNFCGQSKSSKQNHHNCQLQIYSNFGTQDYQIKDNPYKINILKAKQYGKSEGNSTNDEHDFCFNKNNDQKRESQLSKNSNGRKSKMNWLRNFMKSHQRKNSDQKETQSYLKDEKKQNSLNQQVLTNNEDRSSKTQKIFFKRNELERQRCQKS